MQLRFKTWQHNFLIDDEAGKLYKVNTVEVGKGKKKRAEEKLWVWKDIKTMQEGLEYLSTITNIPVWKLRSMVKKRKMEAEK